MTILWPSFLTAVLAEGLFFSLFDPREALTAGAQELLSPLAVYSIGFFFFWTICALASMLTQYLANAPGPHQPPF
ncbi:MAG: hypothetical protein V4508_14375 [Pseudomonadota bacterium]